SHKQMSVEEVTKALGGSGYKKATPTVRHHLDTLKSAGLVEATKMVEVRGAVMKYYAPTLRAFSYDSPDLDKHAKLIEDTARKLLRVLKVIVDDKKFDSSFSGKAACSLCKADHYKEYAALEILSAATARAMERQEYAEMMALKEQAKKQ
ncbi:MAG TPA: helix-turn-helix domain-containing protein, partial [Nitrososphaera sp.]|nr:helix-turn-helix domain-containing protein [Nitrososphaera sp.]